MTCVLLVDDDHDTADVLAATLQEEGYTVRVAEDGQAAIKFLSGHRPGLILLDMLMPNMDGLAFLDWKKHQSENIQDIPTVVWSATNRRTLESTKTMGAVDALVKPADLDTLLTTVKKHYREAA